MKRLLTVLLLLISCSFSLYSHPHTYIDAEMAIEVNDQGITGIRQTWRLLRNFSPDVIEAYDLDRDGTFDEIEVQAVYQKAFLPAAAYRFFTFIDIDGFMYAAPEVEGFTAVIEDGQVVYSFFLPCDIAAAEDSSIIEIVTYDPTGYVSFGLMNVDDQWNDNLNYYIDFIRDGSIYTHSNDFGQLRLIMDLKLSRKGREYQPADDSVMELRLKRTSEFPKVPSETVRNPFLAPDQILETEKKVNPFFS